ncbi:hypothetical protein V6N13_089569 [Hibiscus sabdariffa]
MNEESKNKEAVASQQQGGQASKEGGGIGFREGGLQKVGREVTNAGKSSQKRKQEQDVTLFVENIPTRMQWKGLWHLFARHGDVVRTFITRKLSRGGKRFSIVGFENNIDAERAMERLNGFSVYGYKLTVKKAFQDKKGWAVVREREQL